jgi:hypothetical protein
MFSDSAVVGPTAPRLESTATQYDDKPSANDDGDDEEQDI